MSDEKQQLPPGIEQVNGTIWVDGDRYMVERVVTENMSEAGADNYGDVSIPTQVQWRIRERPGYQPPTFFTVSSG